MTDDEELRAVIIKAVQEATAPLCKELEETRAALADAKKRQERDQKNRAVRDYAQHRFGRFQ